MEVTLTQIGNSQGIVIPKEYLKKLGVKRGGKLLVEEFVDGRIVVGPAGNKKKNGVINSEFLDWWGEFEKEYGPAMEELAKR
jgi:antitoxin component of MazEF toxin-antitoxin module